MGCHSILLYFVAQVSSVWVIFLSLEAVIIFLLELYFFFLLSGIARCSRFILYISCPCLRINLSRVPVPFIKEQPKEPRSRDGVWSLPLRVWASSLPLDWQSREISCVYSNPCFYMYTSMLCTCFWMSLPVPVLVKQEFIPVSPTLTHSPKDHFRLCPLLVNFYCSRKKPGCQLRLFIFLIVQFQHTRVAVSES